MAKERKNRAYRICEAKLRRRLELVPLAAEELRDAREWAHAVKGQAFDAAGGGRGTPGGDGIERRAISVTEAEERLRSALRWDEVMRRLERLYPAGTREGRAAWLLYGWKTGSPLTLERTARLMGVSVVTVRRYRDTYLIACALLAAEAGLIRIQEDEHGDMQGLRT